MLSVNPRHSAERTVPSFTLKIMPVSLSTTKEKWRAQLSLVQLLKNVLTCGQESHPTLALSARSDSCSAYSNTEYNKNDPTEREMITWLWSRRPDYQLALDLDQRRFLTWSAWSVSQLAGMSRDSRVPSMVWSRWCNHPALFGFTVQGLDYSEETFCFVTFRNYFSKDDSSLTLFRSVNRPEDADLRENVDWQDYHLGSRGLRHHRKCQSQDPGITYNFYIMTWFHHYIF